MTYVFTYLLTYLLTYLEQSPSWEANRLASQVILRTLWNRNVPRLQVPSSCPYPEPDQSSPCLPIRFPIYV